MTIIDVNLKSTVDNSYRIIIRPGVLHRLGEELAKKPLGFSYAIITDSNVKNLYGNKLKTLFQKNDLNVLLIDFPAGEKQKNRDIKTQIENTMMESNFGRDSVVIALGGGVVGDIAGFVAATYMRGIPYIQVPTTLVACVDSSIGAKLRLIRSMEKTLLVHFTNQGACI